MSEPVPALASVSTGALISWLVLAVLLGVALGLLGAWLSGRRGRVPAPTEAVRTPATLLVDDLPDFLEHPPGSPAPAAPAVAEPAGDHSARSTLLAMVVAAVVLVALAVVVALTAGRDPGGISPAARGSTPTPAGPAAPRTAAPAWPGAGAAGALAFVSVPLGSDGVAASLTFGGVVLEQRAVGITVTYPSLSVSTDGTRALAHVRLPTFNCLTGEPPADPLAAGCRRTLTEYADLPSPDLRVSRTGDRLDLAGLFPTYTRPKGSAPAYTGRAYQLAAGISPAGSGHGRTAAATGVLQIGLDSAASTPVPGVNVLLFAS